MTNRRVHSKAYTFSVNIPVYPEVFKWLENFERERGGHNRSAAICEAILAHHVRAPQEEKTTDDLWVILRDIKRKIESGVLVSGSMDKAGDATSEPLEAIAALEKLARL